MPASSRASASSTSASWLLGTVAQGEVALLGEDLAGRRGLRAVGHLAGRHDRLADLVEQARALGEEGAAERLEVGRLSIAARWYGHGYTRGEYKETPMAIAIDPVCGMEVDTTTSLLSFEYEGTTYWFCGKGCLLDFQDDPEAFLDPDRDAVDADRRPRRSIRR